MIFETLFLVIEDGFETILEIKSETFLGDVGQVGDEMKSIWP